LIPLIHNTYIYAMLFSFTLCDWFLRVRTKSPTTPTTTPKKNSL